MPRPAAVPAVACTDLTRRFGDVLAVDRLTLTVAAGGCFGLLGPNGAGKTTTIEMLEGLTRPDAGNIRIFGQAWGDGRDQALRARLGVQLQETQLADRLNVLETVRLFRSFYREGRDVDEVLALVGLDARPEARVGKLSGGQRQRLSLACALVGAPDLLFLDEPTTGLDPQARLRIWHVVERFRAGGGTVVLTTHYMEEAERLCDRVAVMDGGRLIAEGTPATLIASLEAAQIVEIRARSPLAPDDFAAAAGVARVEAAGDGLRLAVTNIGEALPALLETLDAHGLGLDSLTTRQPTLEDVFVHLTGRGLRDA